MIEWTEQQTAFLNCATHALVLGGPGSGKTTISLLKAGHEIRNGRLKPGQRVLFLSFARATISRLEQHAKTLLSSENLGELEINTYHGFAWALLRSHGYLLTSGRPLRLLPPPQAASHLATIRGDGEKDAEKRRLFDTEGLVHFDLFAAKAAELLRWSGKLRSLVGDVYPVIVLDEFQDTNLDEWQLIQQFGLTSTLIALADPEQRIYEFRGASPARIPEFIQTFSPQPFDFSSSNHRSAGTDICTFGNDLLTHANKGKRYAQVDVQGYQVRKGKGLHLDLKIKVFQRIKTLGGLGLPHWSIAVLVPTKQLTLDVSDYLESVQTFESGKSLPGIAHEVALETAGPALAAIVLAGVLDGGATPSSVAKRLISDLCHHIKGRKGTDAPSQQQLELAQCLNAYLTTGAIRGPKKKALAQGCLDIGKTRLELVLSGEPEKDWLAVRALFDNAPAAELQQIASDARYLKFLHRGALLRAKLAELWRSHGSYAGASQAVHGALIQEHFAASARELRGIHVMTIHKSKSKEFDEVIIYEGAHQGRIVRANATEKDRTQALLSLRVAVTRARRYATILTPKHDPCPFL